MSPETSSQTRKVVVALVLIAAVLMIAVVPFITNSMLNPIIQGQLARIEKFSSLGTPEGNAQAAVIKIIPWTIGFLFPFLTALTFIAGFVLLAVAQPLYRGETWARGAALAALRECSRRWIRVQQQQFTRHLRAPGQRRGGAHREFGIAGAESHAGHLFGGLGSSRGAGLRAQRRGGIDTSVTTDKLVPGDLVRFDRTYWYVVGLCVTFYAAIFPFRRFANIFFVDAHGASPEQAAFLNGLLPLTAMVATPVFGLIVDRIGRRALLMTLGSLLLVPAFLLMAHSGLPLGVPVAMLGLSFSLVPAILWPSVAYLVDEKRLGTAYALMTFCQQIGWAAMSWAVGRANDVSAASASNPGGYDPGMWMFAALGFLGLSFSALLWRAETRPGAHGLETIVVTRPSP